MEGNELSHPIDTHGPKRLTLIEQVRRAWPEIQAATNQGESLRAVHRRLKEAGIDISYQTLKTYVNRLRQEDAPSPVPESISSEQKISLLTHPEKQAVSSMPEAAIANPVGATTKVEEHLERSLLPIAEGLESPDAGDRSTTVGFFPQRSLCALAILCGVSGVLGYGDHPYVSATSASIENIEPAAVARKIINNIPDAIIRQTDNARPNRNSGSGPALSSHSSKIEKPLLSEAAATQSTVPQTAVPLEERQHDASDKDSAQSLVAATTAAKPENKSVDASPTTKDEIEAGAEIPIIIKREWLLQRPLKAWVAADIYDAASGDMLLPRLSQLLGGDRSFHRNEIEIVWHRIILPDGRYMDLAGTTGGESQPGSSLDRDVNQDEGPPPFSSLFSLESLSEIFNTPTRINNSTWYKFTVQVNRTIRFASPYERRQISRR